MGKLEAERQTLAEALTAAERRAAEDRLRVDELQQAVRSAKAAAESAKQEFQDYKSKATRILQVKTAWPSGLNPFTWLRRKKDDAVKLEFSWKQLMQIFCGRVTTSGAAAPPAAHELNDYWRKPGRKKFSLKILESYIWCLSAFNRIWMSTF